MRYCWEILLANLRPTLGSRIGAGLGDWPTSGSESGATFTANFGQSVGISIKHKSQKTLQFILQQKIITPFNGLLFFNTAFNFGVHRPFAKNLHEDLVFQLHRHPTSVRSFTTKTLKTQAVTHQLDLQTKRIPEHHKDQKNSVFDDSILMNSIYIYYVYPLDTELYQKRNWFYWSEIFTVVPGEPLLLVLSACQPRASSALALVVPKCRPCQRLPPHTISSQAP